MTVSTKTFPPPFQLLNAFGKITRAKRLRRFRFEENAVLGEAMRRTGLTDFGDPRFRDGLQVLLASAERDASLHFLGRISLRRSVVESLINRLLLIEAQKRTPELFGAPLVPPLIVLGLPRSGDDLPSSPLGRGPSSPRAPFLGTRATPAATG